MDSVRATDNASKEVQKTPHRVALDEMLKKVADEEIIYPESIPAMTIMIMTTKTGYAVVGKAVPADPANYDADLGIKFAREDCIRQLWPLEAYLLRERLSDADS